MPGTVSSDVKDPVIIQLGCDPQVSVRLTETPTGTIFVSIEPADPAFPVGDIDGFFFNLTDDSNLDELGFFPEPNTGSIFSPVTGLETNANSVDTLANGAQVKEGYDIGVQFGRVENSTEGEVPQVNFTLFTNSGPLLLDDLDLDSLITVVNSDGGNGQVLTTEDAAGDEPILVDTVALFEDFDDIHDPADSAAIVSDDHWDVRADQLFTNGSNDGTLEFASVESDGPVSIMFDARVNNLDNFEASGRYADELELQVRLDNGDWQTLDTFVINGDKSALVGSETGNEITQQDATLNYEGGVLDDVDGEVQFRFVSDISASNEKIWIDDVKITASELVSPTDGDAVKLDFDTTLVSGDVVDDQFAGVAISAQRAGDSDSSENDAMIFDSNNPTGGDHDLEYEDQGNILIISEDNDSGDADDNARGGTITFDFDAPTDVVSVNLLDIEERGGTIDLLDDNGDVIDSIDIPTTGDGGSQELSINTDGVSTMNVNLIGSGAIDDICYIPPADDAECDAQYDVEYIGGFTVLPMAADDHMAEQSTDEMEEELYV